jgi:hypothetical protein
MGRFAWSTPEEIPTYIWDQAVAEVDSEHGYSVEFASNPEHHRALYRQRAVEIAEAVSEEI